MQCRNIIFGFAVNSLPAKPFPVPDMAGAPSVDTDTIISTCKSWSFKNDISFLKITSPVVRAFNGMTLNSCSINLDFFRLKNLTNIANCAMSLLSVDSSNAREYPSESLISLMRSVNRTLLTSSMRVVTVFLES